MKGMITLPGLLTHYLCGKQVLKNIENKEIRILIVNSRQLFNLGTQGPDILFYYRLWPWTRSHGVEKIGGIMHSEKVNEFFNKAIQYIIKLRGKEKEILTAYLYGYACHYSLDSLVHPYVYYKAGFLRAGEPSSLKYTCYHQRFETAIDVLMLDRMFHQKPSKIKPHSLITLTNDERELIGSLYEYLLREVYNIQISSIQVSQAIKNMVTAQSFFMDKTELKRKLITGFENSFSLPPYVSSMIYPENINDNLDYLNLTHSYWCNPWDITIKFTKSFPEMFEYAARVASDIIKTTNDSVYGKGDLLGTLKFIGNRSFSTGMDCNNIYKFKYFDCIFENTPDFDE
jgi:hypothetical protein